jgi:hypothetical protein
MKVRTTNEPRFHAQTSDLGVNQANSAAAIPIQDPALGEIGDSNVRKANDAEIRELAYRLYEVRGRVDGREMEDWLEAESIIRQGGKFAA